nr:E3 ubiquitin-protein ligase TRIM17-like isoform X1 [Pelodiscus sinensis]|eukprot:XP_025037363.1 E3 ubiquitin-protein ligase TRIM17-like isoform X1 [Pelodiscus sinensis]
MAAGDLAGSFQDEVTCPLCLEYFTDPVSIECGHNFCRACLSQCWGESEPNPSCPQCRETAPQRHLRPNRPLGNLVELVKRLRLPAGPAPEGQPGCERHQEALKLFCWEDQASICVVCRESREHRAHTVMPIEEAVLEYREKLQGALGPLREELEETLLLTSKEEEKTTEWQRKVQAKRETIAAEFNKLHALLRAEEQLLLQRLAEDERATLQRLQENVAKLSQQSASLQRLIAEIEEKCQQPAAQLLKLLSRSRSKNMEEENGRSETLKKTQAINEDYKKTGYDRGHLNPYAFQCDGRAATFTLTNVVPMDPCFNRVRWLELEKHLKAQLTQDCPDPEENAFLVTGVVPNNQHKIPREDDDKRRGIVLDAERVVVLNNQHKIPREDDDKRRGITRDAERVVVPSHIWTAVCCNQPLNNEKFAFAFLGENRPDSILEHMTVTQLSQKLKELYGNNQAIEIFKDDCNEGTSKAKEVLSAITKKLCGDLPNWVKDACLEKEPPEKKPKRNG